MLELLFEQFRKIRIQGNIMIEIFNILLEKKIHFIYKVISTNNSSYILKMKMVSKDTFAD